ncbi:ParB N-terminal domain-containing protein [Amycolatopsis minnesotensis]|uniref:ParB N-terminal domain-containing protein n=2 Tax=Amycolatopsis minnesotensis TaxID=337894 RepID=A0ABN2QMM1_9PSEU
MPSDPHSGLSSESWDEARSRARGSGTTSVLLGRLLSADSPRLSGENPAHTRMLATSGALMPPIVVHRQTMRVIDGTHRLAAAKLRGEEWIEVQFFDGTPEEAFLVAVETNTERGLPLSIAERETAAMRVLASFPQWSDRAIAAKTGLAARTVKRIRDSTTTKDQQTDARIGRDGRVRPLNSVEGRLRASAVISSRPEASLRAVAKEAGISVATAHDVRRRVQRGESPIPDGLAPADAGEPIPRPARPLPTREADPVGAGLDQLWEKISKDPALRFSDSGRALLRWLSFHAITTAELERLMESVPDYGTGAVALLATQCADTWRQFAEKLAERDRASA